MTIKSWQFFSS